MEVKEKIKKLINENDVCLFMKGTPEAPQCGFSMAVSNVLKHLSVLEHLKLPLKNRIEENLAFLS